MSDDARRRLWAAVDTITQPTERKLERETNAEWRTTVEHERAWERGQVCSVAIYRATIERIQAAQLAYGKIPSLWQQATWALTTGSEQAEGGSSPLRERSPADLDLMETMLTIRESMVWQLKGRKLTPKPGLPEQVRQLAAHVVTNEPQHVEWWTYRIAQWARQLATHLRAIDTGPKPLRLRAPCPLCKTRHITTDSDTGPVVANPIVIDFVNGWIRAAHCQACGATWFRGDELGELAALLDGDTPTTPVVANTA